VKDLVKPVMSGKADVLSRLRIAPQARQGVDFFRREHSTRPDLPAPTGDAVAGEKISVKH